MSLPKFLNDKRFLTLLDKLKIKQFFVKITVLNWDEEPIQLVQGRTISGSVNLDGNSTMRRTATLSVYADENDNDLSNIDHLFSLNKKCTIELGITNTVLPYTLLLNNKTTKTKSFKIINYKLLYGDIVWFPLGLFVMFNPSLSHSSSGVTISLQLKDKMCLLNGLVSGSIPAATDFATIDELFDIDSLATKTRRTLVYEIIKELVHHFGNEKLSKIIISEVPLRIKKVVQWVSLQPLLLVVSILYPKLFTDSNENILTAKKNALAKAKAWILEKGLSENTLIKEFERYDDIGFIYLEFTYPEELLLCNSGDAVTTVLDQMINLLGNYLYFYDIEGNFIFREKQNYLNMSNAAYWEKETNNNSNVLISTLDLPSDAYEADTYRLTKSTYNFINSPFVISFNNSVNFNNIKNDFVVWGARKSAFSDEVYPCRFHLAIDKKPSLNLHNIILFEDSSGITRAVGYKLGTDTSKVIKRKAQDWRLLIYYQMLEDLVIGTGENTELNNTYFQYYAELKELLPKIFDLSTNEDESYSNLDYTFAKGWTDETINYPEKIDYFLDFIDDSSGLGLYSVSNIGRRAKIITNENDNCVFEPNIFDIVYVNTTQLGDDFELVKETLSGMGQYWTLVSDDIYENFSTGGFLCSCYELVKDLLYQFTHVNNSISITTIPLYHLLPNSRITVEDAEIGIYGDFIVQSMSLPLDASSTMTINAYRAAQKI